MSVTLLIDYWLIAITALFVVVNPLTTAFIFVSLLPNANAAHLNLYIILVNCSIFPNFVIKLLFFRSFRQDVDFIGRLSHFLFCLDFQNLNRLHRIIREVFRITKELLLQRWE